MEEENLKYCPRCNNAFECNVLSIEQCQCTCIELSSEERVYIASHYSGCLCLNCLQELKEMVGGAENNYPLQTGEKIVDLKLKTLDS